jgi:hypothetical protein
MDTTQLAASIWHYQHGRWARAADLELGHRYSSVPASAPTVIRRVSRTGAQFPPTQSLPTLPGRLPCEVFVGSKSWIVYELLLVSLSRHIDRERLDFGWGNYMQEMILNAYLAYAAQRACVSLIVLVHRQYSLAHRYVFDNYTWDRDGPEISSWNGKPIPARIPLSALISGTLSFFVLVAPFDDSQARSSGEICATRTYPEQCRENIFSAYAPSRKGSLSIHKRYKTP